MAEEQCGISLVGIGVLVAEDEYLIQLLYEDMVERLGGKVLASVGTVDWILSTVEKESPDIVILDVNLKGKLVYDAAIALQQQGIPFILVSGYEILQDSPRALQDAPRVRKPFRSRDLEVALKQALARR